MADHILETKLLLRYGTYSQWINSDLILLPGEAAVAIFARAHNLGMSDTEPENTPPAVGLKIGDGEHYFYELPWVQAIAADVYEWAKAATPPSADTIPGLEDFINAHSSGGGGGSGGSGGSGGYRIIYDSNTNKYILQEFDEANNEWVNTTSVIDLATILERISTIERWANGARTRLGAIEIPLVEYIYEEVVNYLNLVDYNDTSVEHQFVTAVSQNNGYITVTRSTIDASDITSGILSTERGGTGLRRVEDDEVLIGSIEGTITTKKFVTEITNARNTFATTGAIKDYVDEKTAGVTGAMHFIGESAVVIANNSHVDPQIAGYNFRDVQPGDVILANNAQEFVWTGTNWRLLGDEGSYAIKGSITNSDIADEAHIAQSKIDGLEDALSEKVDKVDGKQLSTNDYSNDEKDKLNTIYSGDWENTIEHIIVNGAEVAPNSEKAVSLAIPELTEAQMETINNWQPNPIDHIFINGVEAEPSTINNVPKSVNISHVMSEAEVEKLSSVESGAEVNKVESILINDEHLFTPDPQTKQIKITLDDSVLELTVLEGARYPTGPNAYQNIEITNKKLELSKVAATGDIDDLIQAPDSYLILYCGTSQELI